MKRLRHDESGFGLVELVTSLVLLNVALLALVGVFVAGAGSADAAGRLTTATTLAEARLESFRALRWDDVALHLPLPTDPVWLGDPAYDPATIWAPAACALPECVASGNVVGADGRTYRLDAYVVRAPTGGTLKTVSVVVRDGTDELVRMSTTVDRSQAR